MDQPLYHDCNCTVCACFPSVFALLLLLLPWLGSCNVLANVLKLDDCLTLCWQYFEGFTSSIRDLLRTKDFQMSLTARYASRYKINVFFIQLKYSCEEASKQENELFDRVRMR